MAGIEVWRSVPGYEGQYEVSSRGQVRSLDRVIYYENPLRGRVQVNYKGRILALFRNSKGYMLVGLNRDGKKDHRRVHRLVLEAFVGDREGLMVRHINGIPDDNRLENLRWGTNSDNQLDSVRHRTHHKARNTQCPNGHPYDDANTFYSTSGSRRCRECVRRSTRDSMRRSYAAKKETA